MDAGQNDSPQHRAAMSVQDSIIEASNEESIPSAPSRSDKDLSSNSVKHNLSQNHSSNES